MQSERPEILPEDAALAAAQKAPLVFITAARRRAGKPLFKIGCRGRRPNASCNRALNGEWNMFDDYSEERREWLEKTKEKREIHDKWRAMIATRRGKHLARCWTNLCKVKKASIIADTANKKLTFLKLKEGITSAQGRYLRHQSRLMT